MLSMRTPRQEQCAPAYGSIAPIFRAPFLEKVARGTHVAALLELGRIFQPSLRPSSCDSLSAWFDFFYQVLLEKYRCEYIYKNAIATKLFLSRHSLQTSYLTDELRSAASRADIAILNGTSTVYEIKTKYDSFDRLPSQISDYKKIFDRIYLVTTEAKAEVGLRLLRPEIGVIAMRETGALSVLREATSNKEFVDPPAVFDCMRQAEFCAATREAFGYVPNVPNSRLYSETKRLFCSLTPSQAHDLMVRQIKKRGKKGAFAELIAQAPPSLKHACISYSKSSTMATAITTKLREPLG